MPNVSASAALSSPNPTPPARAGARRAFAAIAAATLALFAACMLAAPQQAHALEATSCTVAPNEDGGDRTFGGTDTRMTIRAQADAEESLTAIEVSLPDGGTLDAESTKVTGLAELDRIDVEPTVTAVGENTLLIEFAQPTQAGLTYLIEAYGTEFPSEGGQFGVSMKATDADGTQADLGVCGTFAITGLNVAEQISSWLSDQPWVQAWNSNKFLHLFLDPTIAVTSIPSVAQGWATALGIVCIAFPLAVPVGFLLALMRMAKFRVLRAIGTTYVNVVRGTPMFLQIYIAFFGLPLLGLNVDNFALGCAVMIFNSCAYLCEIIRAGIQSIAKGQFEAARSLGMTGAQTMLHVIAPQAFRRAIPTMTNELILLYKDTSLLAAVGIMETVMYAKTITAATGNITPYIVAALFYLVVTLPLSSVTRRMEENAGGGRKRRAKKAKGWTPNVDPAKDELAIKTADL